LLVRKPNSYVAKNIIDFIYVFNNYRHSDPKRRPPFGRILEGLKSDKANLLSWSVEDLRMVPIDATVLGGSLSAGKQLFVSLQNTYI